MKFKRRGEGRELECAQPRDCPCPFAGDKNKSTVVDQKVVLPEQLRQNLI
jgi:hypothetical protein